MTERGLGRARAPRSASTLIELSLLLALFVVAWATPPLTPGGEPNAPLGSLTLRLAGGSLCLFRRLTGIDCPGCGLTRCFVQLAHGRWEAAVSLHPLGPLLFAFFGWEALERAARLVSGRALLPALTGDAGRRAYGLLLSGFAVLGVVRIGAALALASGLTAR